MPRVATYGTVVDEVGAEIDRGLALFFEGPHSYTGEDLLELQVHGSDVVAREVVRACIACGARMADAGEFTRRAFLNGKMDLHAASAVADLIEAHSRSAARAALANLAGGLSAQVRQRRAQLAGVLEELAGAIDFPDEVSEPDVPVLRSRLADLANELRALQRDAEVGRLVREGVGVAIVGPPNAGKSSLLNALLGEQRAIVSEIPGTTRDTIEESIVIQGVRVRLIDTAGIRAHAGRLESEGIDRTRRSLAGARVALVVIDGSEPVSAEAREVLAVTTGRPRVVFANKADAGTLGAQELGSLADVTGSVRDRASIDAVRAAVISAAFAGEMPDVERAHLAALHELDAAARALEALENAMQTLDAGDPIDLIAPELQRAYAALGHISGDEASEDLLGGIFARFCIGK